MMNRGIRSLAAGVVLAALLWTWPGTAGADQAKKVDAEAIEEAMALWDTHVHKETQEGTRRLVEMGEPVIPTMLKLIETADKRAHRASEVLGKLGAKARSALPRLLELAKQRATSRSEETESGFSPRTHALHALRRMDWAVEEILPVFQAIAEDAEEEDRTRGLAISTLGKMGAKGKPILQRLADGEPSEGRDQARASLAALLEKESEGSRQKYYADLVEKELFSPEAVDHLRHVVWSLDAQEPHPLTVKVKRAYAERLKEAPDPQLALNLAKIIQMQLVATELEWAAPTDSASGRRIREDPAVHYGDMADALTIGSEHAEKGSELQKEVGVALAKLRLLQGDWAAMNKVLAGMGWKPIAKMDRPFLAAPPTQWGNDLSEQWTLCDPKMRSGSCGLIVAVEKDGKKLPGVHALVKEHHEDKSRVFSTGIRTDTLFFATQPLSLFGRLGSFGYMGQDRALTRYAVSGKDGEVKFEKLPPVPIKIEILVPAGNFVEEGRSWELWMEVGPGVMQRAALYGGGNAVSPNEPPAVVELEPGKTVRYPRLVVLPQLILDVADWTEADPDTFVLEWPDLPKAPGEKITYEVAMGLTGPAEPHGDAKFAKVFDDATIETKTNRWEVGAKGVGGLKLHPGNIYLFQVIAHDASGKILSQSTKKRIWVPWTHRECVPPYTSHDTYKQSPIRAETWHRGTTGYGGGREETLRQRVIRFPVDYPKAFEREYVEVGKAWLDWHDGKKAKSQAGLKKLIKELPATSVPHATAVWLLEQMDAGEEPPKRLYLTAPPWGDEQQSDAAEPGAPAKQWAFAGKVTDPAGKPLAGIHVHWAHIWHQHEDPETTVTDEQGRYRLEVEKLDKYMQLFAFGKGRAPSWRKSITPGPADAPTEIDFQLEPGRKLSGFVVDRSDQPIQGALVRPRTPRKGFSSSFSSPTGGEPLPGSRQNVRTDEDGRFVLEDLPAGEVMLNVQADCRHVNDTNYPVDQQAYIVMRGSGEPGIIHARVIDEATRKPVTDFIVTMRYREGQREIHAPNAHFSWDGLCRDRGYGVTVCTRGDHAPATVKITARSIIDSGEDIVVLKRGKRLELQLVDARTGKPVPEVPIMHAIAGNARYIEWFDRDRYHDGWGPFRQVRRGISDRDGLASFGEGDDKGTLFVLHPGYERMILHPDDRPAAEASGRVRIEMRPEAVVTGVYLFNGKPQPNAGISIWRNYPKGTIEETFETVTTNEQGRFRIGSLTPGVTNMKSPTMNKRLDLGPGQHVVFNFGEGSGPHMLIGRGRPWEDVRLTPEFGEERVMLKTCCGLDGRFQIHGLHPGQYQLRTFHHDPATGFSTHPDHSLVITGDTEIDLHPWRVSTLPRTEMGIE